MTEKRFYYINGIVFDNNKPKQHNGIFIGEICKGLRITNWLNELSDENEQLKAGILSQSEEIEILSEQNERLRTKLERERCSHQKQHEKWENEALDVNTLLRKQIEEYKVLLKQREVK